LLGTLSAAQRVQCGVTALPARPAPGVLAVVLHPEDVKDIVIPERKKD
jgi:hypothetical protein